MRREGTSQASSASPATPAPAKHYILEYKYVADILEKRGPYRNDHIAGAKAQVRDRVNMRLSHTHAMPMRH